MSQEPTSPVRASPAVRRPEPPDPPKPRASPRHAEPPRPPPRQPSRTVAVAYLEQIARVFRARRPGTDENFAAGSPYAPDAEHGGSEGHIAIGAIDAAGNAGEALSGQAQAALSIDIAPLRERIGRCLALHARMTHAWSVATRLRRDILPSSHLVLASDSHGRLSLCLTSALPEVVAVMHFERPALAAVLAEWSSGEPEVDVRLVEAVA